MTIEYGTLGDPQYFTVLSLYGDGRGKDIGTHGFKVLREAMKVQVKSGDRVYWTEYRLGNETTTSNPGYRTTLITGVDGDISLGVSVDLRVKFVFDITNPSNCTELPPITVAFGPGETEQIVTIDRPDPHRRAYVESSVANPRWSGANGNQQFLLGISERTTVEPPQRSAYYGEARTEPTPEQIKEWEALTAGMGMGPVVLGLNDLNPVIGRTAAQRSMAEEDTGDDGTSFSIDG
ncbi:hypothetical protein OHS33_20955 [Streptomyces sp. NBC_00536]|uniref:hypothetical protein n=1 Tax=Streptomyces sp. NBC_00536 TaxID=2975769 RepID=UPI002E7FBD91|nr:hypothetical protein [Streptomyces sp. NBC_00536]WUC80571.1 hypothetical protein OHS33_20955 [Streptomyces sp. NBC_00536]